ncbi:MAG: tRNA (adenosine(37)-N6)-threonylcarbamoyltransferase complex ATPase subunit type 1 TsaE [Hellea sp.]
MQRVNLRNEAETLALGAKLIAQLSVGQTVCLTGGLGAGKTTLVRGMIQSVLGNIDVPSPTYTLVQTYDMPEFELWHCDMYRLERPEDGYELGLMDAFEEAVCLIEWPDKLGGLISEDALAIDIQFEGEGRTVTLTGFKEII